MTISKVYSQSDLDELSPVTIIAKVTNCLSFHEKCTGRYIDSSFKYIITCSCDCHSKKQVASACVEELLANAAGNDALPFQGEIRNDR